MNDNSMPYDWYKVRYKGDIAKNAIALGGQGIGYIILESGKDKGEVYCIAAYKQTLNGPIPEHVEQLTDYEKRKVKWRLEKHEKQHENRANPDPEPDPETEPEVGPETDKNDPDYYKTA